MSATTRVPVALIGAGRMGKALAALAPERACDVVAMLDVQDTISGIARASLNGAAVAIEFTEPSAAIANAVHCLKVGCPVVIGTTGWQDRMPLLVEAVEQYRGRALWSPNFSLGVQLFLAIAEDAARRVKQMGAEFDVQVVETHHAAKKDAPSGTAIAIASALGRGFERDDVRMNSIRIGHVPGTHEVLLDAPFEQIRLTHEARDRRVFADGALHAARWLSRQEKPGLYTMRDLIDTGNVETR